LINNYRYRVSGVVRACRIPVVWYGHTGYRLYRVMYRSIGYSSTTCTTCVHTHNLCSKNLNRLTDTVQCISTGIKDCVVSTVHISHQSIQYHTETYNIYIFILHVLRENIHFSYLLHPGVCVHMVPHSTLHPSHTHSAFFFFLSYKIEKQCVYMYLLSGQQI
jgi:hypothetical protein